jgi:DNA polymerase I-like protein with 3'-5' exonuclease and polymerase domains
VFSTLNQSTGVFCFDSWIAQFRNQRPQLTAQFHDEVVLEIKKGNRDKATALLQDAIQRVNDEVKLNVKLAVDIKFGDNYASIH